MLSHRVIIYKRGNLPTLEVAMAKIAKTTKNIIKCSVCVHQANEHKYKILAIDIEGHSKLKF